MQTIKVIKFCTVCCLKSIFFAIFLLPLISAENLNNETSGTIQYRPWKTISARVPILDMVTNISHEFITSPAETDTIFTTYNAYFFLCVHQNLRRSCHYILRSVENHIIHDTSYYIQQMNNNRNDKENGDKYKDTIGKSIRWSVEQHWEQKELVLKGERDIAGVNIQYYRDDIFEIALYIILAIFVEVIPISMRYVCKKTILCWRRLQLFCCFYHRNYAKTPYSLKQLQQRRSAVINCVYNVVKLNRIKFKRRSDQQQKQLFILHQKYLSVFAVITGKIFALFIQRPTTESAEISLPAVAGCLYTTREKLIFFPGLPTMVVTTTIIAQNCKKSYQHYFLKACLIDTVTFSSCAQIVIDRKNRLLPKQVTCLVREIQQLQDLSICCDYIYFYCGENVQGNTFLYAYSENKEYRIRCELLSQPQPLYHNLRNFEILQLLFDHFNSNTNSKFKEVQSGEKHKSKRKSGKHFKSIKLPKASSHWTVPLHSADRIVYTFKCQRIEDSTNWEDCLHAIIKFDLCCCCWCFYCYRRSERVSNGCSDDCYRCCSRHRRQCAFKSLQCIYCYYFHCYYFLNQCYCCCCCSKPRTTSLMYPYSCLSNESNYHLPKYCFNAQQNEKETKQPRVAQQLKYFRKFFRPQVQKNASYICSTLSALYSCHTIYWFQNSQHCCSQITKANTLINTMNLVKTACAKTISNKKTDFINSICCSAIYFGKCLYYKLINLADYLRRHMTAVIQVKISVPLSTVLVIKVTRDQQQQQQQMVNIAHDQQLKMNNLCKIFCNNWKRHRRRRRRRRRRRMNKQEQQQHQSVQLQQQHLNNEKETVLSSINNPRLHILNFNAYKAIATNVPVHMILSKALTASMLAAMRLANTKFTLTDGNRKDVIGPLQTPTLNSSPPSTTTASITRFNRSRSRPNLVWLFIGLVWFEGPKYVNCTIHSSSQSTQSTPQTQSQTQTVTETTQTTLQPFSTSTLLSQRQQHKMEPSRITSNLRLLTPNYKQILKGSMSFMQRRSTSTIADTAAYKTKQGGKSNLDGEGIHIGNCLSSRRRASVIAIKPNGKHTRSYDIDPIVIADRKRYDWLEPEVKAEADFLDEEGELNTRM